MILALNLLTVVRKFQTYLYLANLKSTASEISVICSFYFSYFDSINIETLIALFFRPSRVTYIIQICPSVFCYL